MADELKTMAEELKTTAISKLPEAISVSEGDCILVVQNRKAKKARPSLFRGPKGDIGLTGATGANPVLKFSSRGIEAKLSNQADSAFTLLVPIASITGSTGPQGLTGATGANIIPRAGETGIEYKLSTEPDTAYRLLVPYSQITGPQGEPGKDFQILGYFDTLDLLKAGITTPNPGDAYGVGTEAPYPIYIWDGINNLWRDNGAIQGPAGRSGKSARVNRETGYWEEFDDDILTWRQTEAVAVYPVATVEKDGLMSKEDKVKLDQMNGGDVEVSKTNIEKVLTGDITSHSHDRVIDVVEMPTDIWDGVSVSSSLIGSGTKDNPYLIQSCADYIHFYRHPSLYSYSFAGAVPSEEQIANIKQIKFTSNLDFNNIAIDFSETVPDLATDSLGEHLFACYIDGQGCSLYNINFVNSWAVIPVALFSVIKDLHVNSGVFTVPLSIINDKGYNYEQSQTAIAPWGMIVSACEAENVSFVAEVKLTGDITSQIAFVSGAIVTNDVRSVFADHVKEKISFYSNVTFSSEEGSNNLVAVAYSPAVVSYNDSAPIQVLGYDCSLTAKDISTLPESGLFVGMMLDIIGQSPYAIYVNMDNATPNYQSSSITPFHTAKTTAEMKSADFLSLLNGDTETFIADINNINQGYPIFKPKEQIVYDGYASLSEFEKLKENTTVYNASFLYDYMEDNQNKTGKITQKDWDDLSAAIKAGKLIIVNKIFSEEVSQTVYLEQFLHYGDDLIGLSAAINGMIFYIWLKKEDYSIESKCSHVAYNSREYDPSSTSSNIDINLEPNIFYEFKEVSSLTIRKAGTERFNRFYEYMFQFSSGATPTTLNILGDIKWIGGAAPTIKANKTYQVSIVNNLAVIGEW